LFDAFGNTEEHVKTAASYALGCVVVGNMARYLPYLLEHIQTDAKHQYLLLHTLKEVIAANHNRSDAVVFAPFVQVCDCSKHTCSHAQILQCIWTALLSHADGTEEGTRNVVGECIGRLVLTDSATLLTRLRDDLNGAHDRPLVRATLVTAVKFVMCSETMSENGGKSLFRLMCGDGGVVGPCYGRVMQGAMQIVRTNRRFSINWLINYSQCSLIPC
jgi:cullin-associated NEDD8-dissociated protein 1